jgi:hypothetical protein
VALTLIQREAFADLGTLDSDTPGGFSSVSGTLTKRPVGPRLTTDASRGWSAIAGGGAGKWSIGASGGQADTTYQYFAESWLYVDSYNLDTTDPAVRFLRFIDVRYTGNGSSQWCFGVQPDGTFLYTSNDGFTDKVPGTNKMPLRQWVQLRLCFQMRSGGFYEYDIQMYWRPWSYDDDGNPVAGAWTKEFDLVDKITFVSGYDFYFEANGNGGIAYVRGRMGAPAIYKTTSAADCLLETPDVLPPDGLPSTWYVADGGSDDNDGTSPASAWATPTKLDDEINSEGGILSGDTIQIDGVVWDNRGLTVPAYLPFNAINFVNNRSIFHKDISAPGTTWALESGKTHVYSTTNGGAADIDGCYITEAGLPLDKLDLANYANAAALLTALDSTPGTMWEDGTKIYVNTLLSDSPATNGHTFLRSKKFTYRDGSSGASMIVAHAPGIIDGGGLLFDMIGDAASSGATGLQTYVTLLAYAPGTYVFRNATIRGWRKHGMVMITNVSDVHFEMTNITDLGGLPFGSFGDSTNAVVYVGAAGITNITARIANCTIAGVALQPKTSNVYATHNGFAALYTHQLDEGGSEGSVTLTLDQWRSPPASPITFQEPMASVVVKRSRLAVPAINDDVPVSYVGMQQVGGVFYQPIPPIPLLLLERL